MTRVLSSFLWMSSCLWMLSPVYATVEEGEKQATAAGKSSRGDRKQSKSKKVYTNEDLIQLKDSVPINQAPATTSKSSKTSSKANAAAGAERYRDIHGHDRNYWQPKIRPLRRRLESLDSQIASLQAKQSKLNPASGLKVTRSGKLQASSSDTRAQLTKRLDDLKEKRAEALKSIEEIQEDARKAQALPEWLR
jgi:hypothetical protein